MNAARKAIQTLKNHLIAGLCTCDSRYPGRRWNRIIPQEILPMNLFRASKRNPYFSAYAAMFGEFNINATPLTQPDTSVPMHIKLTRDELLVHIKSMDNILVQVWTITGVNLIMCLR